MAKTHRRLFANTPPQITAETVRGVTMEGFAVDRGPATKGSHSWTEPLSPSAEDHEDLHDPLGATYRIYRNPLPSSTVLSNTDELVVTEQQNEGTTKERKQDTSSGVLRPCVFGIIADRFLSPSVAQRCCFAFSGAPERRTAEGCCGGVRRGSSAYIFIADKIIMP
ncbi:predicted protein [Histoplasma capsulatum G186AR]|uniref:Uncharacterized protein n=1 Tax=Ajellomyces capsulatus (strain G186AR / H82 / ATCC MYA-2454 / RMSCC 2432) TaxID=447093 RepID=C0NP44_AJECG|nr:uncharacterized protein HCBG_04924 [Histoplasma capsulatum G186AR]EEH06704.1 predicted protein [Histoplasma capsulatum G186AR]